MSGSSKSDSLLAYATTHGLLVPVGAGRAVAGVYADPVTGTEFWLLEYVSSEVLADPAFGELVREACIGEGVPAMDILVKTPPDRAPAGSVHFMHFLLLPADPPPAEADAPSADAAVVVRVATPEDDPLVRRYLATAIEDGYAAGEMPVSPERAAEVAAEVVAREDRQSFVAESHGVPVGHLTLLTDPTGDESVEFGEERLIEVVDVLVEDAAVRRPAEAALVTAAHRFAAPRGLDLLGSVICEVAPAGAARPCERITTALIGRGWRPVYDYVRVPG